MVVQIFNWASIHYIREVRNCFFLFYGDEIHTCATVKDHIEDCILYHIRYTTIEALLYQPLRFILTLTVIEVRFFWEGSIAIMTCITLMHPFYALHLSLLLMAKTTAQSVCKNN